MLLAAPTADDRTAVKRFKIFALAVFLPVILAAARSNAAERPSVDQLVDFFDEIVFGSEFGELKRRTIVHKWKRPLRVVVREYGEIVTDLAGGRRSRQLEQRPVNRRFTEIVQRHLNTLTRLTGLKTQDAGTTRWPANFIINFVPPLQLANPRLAAVDGGILRRLAAQGGCYFITWPDKAGGGIQKAVIVVNKSRAEAKTIHCVLEEMAQSLGLPNDGNPSWPSIFANTGSVPEPSWPDRVMIRALYDPRMTPGLARREALAVARTVITELSRNQR